MLTDQITRRHLCRVERGDRSSPSPPCFVARVFFSAPSPAPLGWALSPRGGWALAGPRRWWGGGVPGSPARLSVQRLFSVRRRQRLSAGGCSLRSKVWWYEESKTVPSLSPAASSEPSAALWDPPAPTPTPLPCLHAINWECLGVTSPVTHPRPGRATCFGRSALSDCYLVVARARRGRAGLGRLCSLQEACDTL